MLGSVLAPPGSPRTAAGLQWECVCCHLLSTIGSADEPPRPTHGDKLDQAGPDQTISQKLSTLGRWSTVCVVCVCVAERGGVLSLHLQMSSQTQKRLQTSWTRIFPIPTSSDLLGFEATGRVFSCLPWDDHLVGEMISHSPNCLISESCKTSPRVLPLSWVWSVLVLQWESSKGQEGKWLVEGSQSLENGSNLGQQGRENIWQTGGMRIKDFHFQ